jgi:hypothetical protein
MPNQRHQYESALANSILKKMASSERTRALLNELGMKLAQHVLTPLEGFLAAGELDINQWPEHYQKAMLNMAKNHSGKERQ